MVGAVTIDNTAQQIQQLQGAVKALLNCYRVVDKIPNTTDSTICTTTCARQS